MKYASALALSEAALETDPVTPTLADVDLIVRFNPGASKGELADFYTDVYVSEGVRLIVGGDGSGYLVSGDRVYFIPAEADDDEVLAEALL